MLEDIEDVTCPYCGETVELEIDLSVDEDQEYVQDCSVCCRPWTVVIQYEGGDVRVLLKTDA